MAKPIKLPRVTEPGYSPDMVHYGPYPMADAVTLCGKTDWLGEETGKRTDRPVTCNMCLAIVQYVKAGTP